MRHVTGYLWQHVWFRELVLVMMQRGIATHWLCRNTPVLIGLRNAMLEEGHLDVAREASDLLREIEEGKAS